MLKARVPSVTCLVVCLISIPWTSAFAGERPGAATEVAQTAPRASMGITNSIREASQQYRLEARRQSVASTTESKLLLGVTAGALIVVGAAMVAYGSTSSCKANHASSGPCDKTAMVGALGLSGGTAMLALWALSRP